jgi:cytochrome c peroxidase
MRTVISSAIIASSTLYVATVQADLKSSVLAGLQANCGTQTNPATCRVNTKVQAPLSAVKVPEPTNLYEFVSNKQRAIELGKALFWDMQVGSDGVQACASCHFNAGADSRTKNQLSPGILNVQIDQTSGSIIEAIDTTFEAGKGANYQLAHGDFPHHQLSDITLFNSATLIGPDGSFATFETTVLRSTNDVVSSQGVHYTKFVEVNPGDPVDGDMVEPDPDGFQVGSINTRRVEPRNTPTNINAVFNYRNFWDGRASQTFNGVNNAGDRDTFAYVYVKNPATGALEGMNISIDNGSLASQAMDPPVSKFEMSADGRTWIDIGDKLSGTSKSHHDHSNYYAEKGRNKGKRVNRLRPLASQQVSKDDSVLGDMSAGHRGGLKVRSYNQMIKRAFKREWWGSKDVVRINEDGSRTIVPKEQRTGADNEYTQIEMNFSLFFGLSVQLYQATLVADQTPFDAWLAGDSSALTEDEVVGFFIAHDEGRCLNCHGGPELTFASVSQIEGIVLKDGIRLTNGQGVTRIRRNNLIDEGFNNIGVRPTEEDLGVGGENALGPLSFARRTHLGENGLNDVVGDAAARAKALGADGAFKIPGLRNVALTAPYFHNGGEKTLEDVIDFYFRGGNFRKYAPTRLTDCASTIPATQARLVDHPVQGFNAERTEEVIITGLGILRGPLANSGPGSDTPPVGGDCDPNDDLAKGAVNPSDGLDDADRGYLVAWLKSLTDQRVVRQEAPFDHPQLFVTNGHSGDHVQVIDDDGLAKDSELIEIAATGRYGNDQPQPSFESTLAETIPDPVPPPTTAVPPTLTVNGSSTVYTACWESDSANVDLILEDAVNPSNNQTIVANGPTSGCSSVYVAYTDANMKACLTGTNLCTTVGGLYSD